MSKRLNAWLCLQIFALNLIGCGGALAEEAKGDSSANPPQIQSESKSSTNNSSSSETGGSTPAQATSSDAGQPSPQGGAGASTASESAAKESSSQATPADQGVKTTEPKTSAQQAKPEHSIEAHTTPAEVKPSPVASSKKIVLYGRIEQIAAGSGAQFPIVLKSMKAQMDSRHPELKASASESALRGAVVRSFPTDFDGVWGGSLTVWTMQQSPLCWQIDPDEAKWTQAAMRSGLVGQTNFNFSRGGANQIQLEPARILFAVPIKDTNQQAQVDQLLGSGGLGAQLGSQPGMANMMRQFMGNMASSMTVPMTLNLGNFQTSGTEQGVSGNQLEERVVRNIIRELAPGVLEQQIITSEAERNAHTGQLRYGYGESVIRLTKQTSDQLYAQVATVTYTQDRQFRRKIILYGALRRGVVMNTSPDPMAGFGNMLNMPGGGNGQMPRMPQFPPGQNPFENLFPH